MTFFSSFGTTTSGSETSRITSFGKTTRFALGLGATLVTLAACGGDDNDDSKNWETSGGGNWPPVPTVVAHRGASALRPEHTLEAYRQAIEDGADIIEPDLVITRDGVLIARHENAIAILNADGTVREATTDVVDRPEFASRKTTKTIDGTAITGWFTEDFTLAEIKTLRARERIPAIRPGNVRYDNQFAIPTFQEVIDLARSESQKRGRTIGVYPETKHPTFFQSIGKPLEAPLVAVLNANKLTTRDAPVFVQSFEVANLQQLRTMTNVRLAQLISDSGRPYDFIAKGAAETRSYADLVTPAAYRQSSPMPTVSARTRRWSFQWSMARWVRQPRWWPTPRRPACRCISGRCVRKTASFPPASRKRLCPMRRCAAIAQARSRRICARGSMASLPTIRPWAVRRWMPS
jgi:glycerophosphoryl diester phosphodiesterase